jgi:hypothetical protein
MKDQQEKAKAAADAAKQKGYTPQRTGTHPSHDLAEYAGEYENPGYGVARVESENGGLKFTFHDLGGPLVHYHYDVFEVKEAELNPFSKMKVQFHSDLQGDVDSFAMPLESTVKEIVFTRLGDRKMKERTFLQPLTGSYQRGPASIIVAMKGDNAITATIPGQGTMDLTPVRGTRFNVKGLTGYSVEFKGDDLVFYQPNGTFVATRKK